MITTEIIIWEDNLENNWLFKASELKEKLYIGENFMMIEGVETADLPSLNKALLRHIQQNVGESFNKTSLSDVQQFFQNEGYLEARVRWADEYEDVQTCLVFDFMNNMMVETHEFETVKTYTWMDGSNPRTLSTATMHDIFEKKVEVTAKAVSLDQWNGHSLATGGIGLHECIYKIVKLNGEEVEDMYLLHKYSDWKDNHAQGYILTIEQVKARLEELNLNVEDCLYEIGKLSGE
ncbi:hypothetical protein D7X33_17710 [Butyricicoccus sp. 1XD8-22]|nr:hypothetical protein D7X33_17710 [Butyricicoccus sp. 1XD8-22]